MDFAACQQEFHAENKNHEWPRGNRIFSERIAHAGGSSKFQTPNSKEAPNFKFQKSISSCEDFGLKVLWNLVSGDSLELGTWNLELFSIVIVFPPQRSHLVQT
jgi:hypothetical protein